MISTEKCCFDNWENFPNSNLCVRQNNSGFSSIFLHNPPLYIYKVFCFVFSLLEI